MSTKHLMFPVRALAAALLVAAACLAVAASARADFGVKPGTASLSLSTTQAGGHPDVTTAFNLNTAVANGHAVPDGNVRDLDIDLPAGIVGDPSATPTCTEAQLTSNAGCPASTQVGTGVNKLMVPSGFVISSPTAVYNLEHGPHVVAAFGFRVIVSFVKITVTLRNGGDYGITAHIENIPQTVSLVGTSLTFWGVPADHNGSGFTRRPFMTNATSCAGPQQLVVHAKSWQGATNDATIATQATTGCDGVPFDPSISVQPTTTQAAAPTGLDVDVHVPQHPNPDGIESSTLKDAVVTLPDGLVVSPSSADGLGACSEAQIDLHSASAPTCPDSSKLGTVTIDTPLLPDALTGSIYLAQQGDRPDNGTNPFGSMLALYLVTQGDGVTVKLAGKITPDPTTGRLTTTFLDNPQLPFADLKLSFKAGARAPLANPTTCGPATTTGSLTPHSSSLAKVVSDTYTVTGCGDPKQFAPGFSAGVTNPQAGASSPFTLTFNRSDADQALGRISITMPPGLLGHVGDVPRCASAAAAIGACPEASRIGSATTTAGPGSQPFAVKGSAYLTEGYGGGQYGLAVVVPVVAGPLNLGTVVVRQAIFVDPHDVHLTIVSDPLPTILDGIPLEIRSVNVTVNRPGFMINPTRCNPTQVGATIVSALGQKADVASRFQVGGCDALPLAPRLSLAMGGKGEVRKDGHPTFTAKLTQQPGESGLRQVAVALPKGLSVDLANLKDICAQAQVDAGTCPARTIVGKASVVTPVLDAPLVGPIYLVEGAGKGGLPRLWLPLRGPVALDLWASSSFDTSTRLVTTFTGIPDAPITRFDLQIDGGREGILMLGNDPCTTTQQADQQIDGQNGHHADATLVVGDGCAFRVLSRSLSRTSLKVKVGGVGAGRLTVTGAGVRKTTRALGATQVTTVTAKLSAIGRQMVAAGRAVHVKVALRSADGSVNSATTTARLAR